MELFNIYNLYPFFTSILFLLLGLFVYYKNKKSIINITFLLICLATFVWQFSWFLLFGVTEDFFVNILIKIGWLGIIFIPITFYHFFVSFLEIKTKKETIILYGAYLVSFIFSLFLIFTRYFIDGYFEYFWGYYPKAGIIHPIFLGFLSLLTIRIFWLILKETQKERRGIRFYQIKFIFWALILYVFSAVDFIINYGVEIYPFGFIFVIGFLGIISYTIITYRLLNIKLVLRQSSVYIISLSVIFGLASVAKIFVTKYLGEFSFWMDLMVIFFAVLVFPYIKDYFLRVANKYFFTSLYDSGKLILKTGNDLKTFLNIEKVYEYLYSTFWKNLHTKAFGVLSYDEENKNYNLQYNQGFKARKGDIFDRNSLVEATFIENNQIVITEELKNVYSSPKTKDLIELLESLGVELLIPLKVKGNVIGLLALGPKETEEAYNDEDLQVLEIISGQAAVAIENAQLYSEVKNFNLYLKREVKKATEDVKKANKDLSKTNQKLKDAYNRLKQLDSAKNEFISIASHQLRTPLTSIKGFISMIREGDYGKIEKETDEALKKIFISNERLIKLVNDLLSLSRIESGRFTFIFRENDIGPLVKSILDNFKLEAQEKDIKLKYNKPKKPIKSFLFDRDKMHEVISNLIDNAIKYTLEGRIEVSLEDSKDKVSIIIKDTGKGMEKDEAKYIFEKFRRGIGSSNLNTEGTGLGLYVCRKIVDAHKGKIYANSDGPEKGSQFIIELRKDLKVEEEKK